MIAADTSTWVAFLEGAAGSDVAMLNLALQESRLLMVPIVLTELLSDPKLPPDLERMFCEVPTIGLEPGYWERAGKLRAQVLVKRRKARLGDALIAQMCVDRGVPLITRDRDFRAFAEAADLEVILAVAR